VGGKSLSPGPEEGRGNSSGRFVCDAPSQVNIKNDSLGEKGMGGRRFQEISQTKKTGRVRFGGSVDRKISGSNCEENR